MSRFYDIIISGPTAARYTSFVNGAPDPGALQIEIDATIYDLATQDQNALVRIYGISLETISQAKDFNGAPIQVYVGMSKGLPLAKPDQAGLILSGTIFQAFGNWIGTAMTLDLIIVADGTPTNDAKNFVVSWKKGQTLATALTNTLATAYPDFTTSISINTNLVATETQTGYYATIGQLAQWVRATSIAIVGGTYTGVRIVVNQKVFKIFDGTTQTAPIQISFEDLIGQPTWIAPGTIQFNTTMRADITVGDYVKLPQTIVTTTAQSLSQARDNSVFQGVFQVAYLRDVGNSRAPDAQSWISTFNAIPAAAA